MSSDSEPLTESEKLKVLRRIQYLIDPSRRLLVRDAGLTQKEFEILADEQLIEVSFFRDEGLDIDRYHIDKILPKGLLILAQSALTAPDPLKVVVLTPKKSIWQRICDEVGNKLLAVIMNALSAVLGAVIGWYLKKYFP